MSRRQRIRGILFAAMLIVSIAYVWGNDLGMPPAWDIPLIYGMVPLALGAFVLRGRSTQRFQPHWGLEGLGGCLVSATFGILAIGRLFSAMSRASNWGDPQSDTWRAGVCVVCWGVFALALYLVGWLSSFLRSISATDANEKNAG